MRGHSLLRLNKGTVRGSDRTAKGGRSTVKERDTAEKGGSLQHKFGSAQD